MPSNEIFEMSAYVCGAHPRQLVLHFTVYTLEFSLNHINNSLVHVLRQNQINKLRHILYM